MLSDISSYINNILVFANEFSMYNNRNVLTLVKFAYGRLFKFFNFVAFKESFAKFLNVLRNF